MLKSMNEIDNDRTQEPHQDVQDREMDDSSNSIGHEDYHPIWSEDETFLVFSLGTRILILNSNGE
jgi:hypothetical protein